MVLFYTSNVLSSTHGNIEIYAGKDKVRPVLIFARHRKGELTFFLISLRVSSSSSPLRPLAEALSSFNKL